MYANNKAEGRCVKLNLVDFLEPKKENNENEIANLDDTVIEKIADKVVAKLSAVDDPTEQTEQTEQTKQTEQTEQTE